MTAHNQTSWPEIDWLSPDVKVDLTPSDGWYVAMKPSIDFLMAALITIPALPVIAACWLLVRLTSSGPGFYVQVRSGLRGRPYKIIKLRTMSHNAELTSGILWSQKGDCRVTKVGNFLRTTHLDELPQLFNVLRGEMSLVGPRPERPEVIRAKGLGQHVPGYDYRLSVRPGVTGLAQIQLPADSDLKSVRHKVVYDLYYITKQNVWLDLRLLAATVVKAAGGGPVWLRRLFFLPSRNQVALVFRNRLTPPPPPVPDSSAGLQPV
ncbi:sugar transferase [Fimbriiglobus ruber]|uniref:Bacterial sugar transferase n=1 Tax=Fimbriiglobus ruber TaxID=1908690 RepID=A0A225EGS9_9BACT|nr:sugar transferase [Fimbriiglobus ruber]OWK47515.1 Bacterial sugar transferase [Fimbriiglobus ruber]